MPQSSGGFPLLTWQPSFSCNLSRRTRVRRARLRGSLLTHVRSGPGSYWPVRRPDQSEPALPRPPPLCLLGNRWRTAYSLLLFSELRWRGRPALEQAWVEAPWPLEFRRHPRLFQTIPVGGSVGQPGMAFLDLR